MRSPPIGIVLGIVVGIALGVQTARRPRVVSLPVPTSETIPYVAEVMGATSYEEVVEDDESNYPTGNKRVQRKLNVQGEGEKDLDPEHRDYQEYQGNKTRVMGRPGVDFPILPHIPRTEFSCRKVKKSGYYADLETGCQVFHICDGGRKISFLCPNGTIFRQSHLICDWWFRVDCERSVELYDESAEQLAHDQMVYKKRAEDIARAMRTSGSTTERSSNFRQTRRKNEKLVDLSAGNNQIVDSRDASASNQAKNIFSVRHENTFPTPSSFSNQAENTFVPSNPSTNTFVSSNQAANTFVPSNPVTNTFASSNQAGNTFVPNNPPTNKFVTSNQAANTFIPSNSATNTFASSQTVGTYKAGFTNTNPSGPASLSSSTQFLQQTNNPPANPVFVPDSGSFSSQNFISAPSGPQNTFQPANPTGEQVYQQANEDFNHLGLATNAASSFQSNQGSTNYKFSYTASSSGQSSSPPRDFTNNQVFSGQSAVPQEKERQVLAETASFASNRHRFGNQLDQAYYQNIAYTATPATPSTTSSDSYSSSTTRNDYKSSGNAVGSSTKSGSAIYKDTASYKTGGAGAGAAAVANANAGYNPGLANNYNTQEGENLASTTRAPSTTRGANRGSQTYQSSIVQQYNQQHSTPSTTVVLVPSSSQVYNSHMQPYTALNKNPVQTSNSWSVSQNTYSWQSPPASSSSTHSPDGYKGESSSQTFSTYNTFSTAQSSTLKSLSQVKDVRDPSSTAKPYRGKAIFNVKIKPNKDYSLIELHRLITSTSPSTARFTTTVAPVTTAQSSSHATFSPQQTSPQYASSLLTSTLLSTYPVMQHKYATVNITGTPEEIRPEVVNSLMDFSIKPTSADALHTFASYYGSAETDDSFETFTTGRPHVSDVLLNLRTASTESPDVTTTIKPITSTNGNDLPSELTKITKDSYSFLFSDNKARNEHKDDLTPKESGSAISDLSRKAQKQIKQEVKSTRRPTEPTTTTQKPEATTPKFRDSSELRELAQVFSRALSAYLEDPETFKEILAQVRPTEPNPTESSTQNPDDEVLDFSDASQSRTGTTEPPGTTVFSTDDVTADISIGEINNLVSSSKSGEYDNSYETNSVSPIAAQSVIEVEFTTPTPTVAPNDNSVPSGMSADYYTKLGTVEDTSYFPTAGGVNDDTRPRYGGFHNNTKKSKYSPYGADLKNNVTTGTPITEATTVPFSSTTPPSTTTQFYVETTTFSPTSSILPAAQQVNNLVGNQNLLYGPSAQFTSSSEEEFDRSLTLNEQEKLLLASGSQSLVSSHNYASFAENFNKNGQKLYGKDTFANYAPSAPEYPSAVGNEFLPYFGQEPPFETISQPTAFQTQTPNFGDRIVKNQSEFSDFNTQASVNTYTIDSHNGIHTNVKPQMSDRVGTVLPLLREDTAASSVTWTVSPYETTFSSSSSVEMVSNTTSSVVKPTTYHPNQASESTTQAEIVATEATTSPTVQETTTDVPWTTTMSPDHPEYHNKMQEKALEMFGMLNETAAHMLMEVMTKAENNMNIRKLVLLLVNDRSKQKSSDQSRANLINALLTHDNDIEETTPKPSSTTPLPKKKVMKIMRIRASSSRSMKIQRALDTQTAVAGTNSFNVTDLNKANAAKLYIPSGPATTTTTTTTTTTPHPTTSAPKLPYDSDARALELLKTLYNLAAKWG